MGLESKSIVISQNSRERATQSFRAPVRSSWRRSCRVRLRMSSFSCKRSLTDFSAASWDRSTSLIASDALCSFITCQRRELCFNLYEPKCEALVKTGGGKSWVGRAHLRREVAVVFLVIVPRDFAMCREETRPPHLGVHPVPVRQSGCS